MLSFVYHKQLASMGCVIQSDCAYCAAHLEVLNLSSRHHLHNIDHIAILQPRAIVLGAGNNIFVTSDGDGAYYIVLARKNIREA
jgi:hypothetical protein